MDEREARLRAGKPEIHRQFDGDGKIFFYWEPYTTEKGEYTQGFTIDHGSQRWRFDYFEVAVRHLELYERELDIAAALKALGIQGGSQ